VKTVFRYDFRVRLLRNETVIAIREKVGFVTVALSGAFCYLTGSRTNQ